MYKIIEVAVDWCPTYDNSPRLIVRFDELGDIKDLRYTKNGNLYRAILGDYVNFYHWKGPHNEGGYAGREYPITLDTGEVVTLRGPWSPNADSVNKKFKDILVTEVSYTAEQSVWDDGYTFYAGAATWEGILAHKDNLHAYCKPPLKQVEQYELEKKQFRFAVLTNGNIQPVILSGPEAYEYHGNNVHAYDLAQCWETKEQWRFRTQDRKRFSNWKASSVRINWFL